MPNSNDINGNFHLPIITYHIILAVRKIVCISSIIQFEFFKISKIFTAFFNCANIMSEEFS